MKRIIYLGIFYGSVLSAQWSGGWKTPFDAIWRIVGRKMLPKRIGVCIGDSLFPVDTLWVKNLKGIALLVGDTALFAWNSDSLNGLHSSQFLRSDAPDTSSFLFVIDTFSIGSDGTRWIAFADKASPGRLILSTAEDTIAIFVLARRGVGKHKGFCSTELLIGDLGWEDGSVLNSTGILFQTGSPCCQTLDWVLIPWGCGALKDSIRDFEIWGIRLGNLAGGSRTYQQLMGFRNRWNEDPDCGFYSNAFARKKFTFYGNTKFGRPATDTISNWEYIDSLAYIGDEDIYMYDIAYRDGKWYSIGVLKDSVWQWYSDWVRGDWISPRKSWYVGHIDDYMLDLTWDGSYWWLVGTANDSVYRFDSSFVYTGVAFPVAQYDSNPHAILYHSGYFYLAGIHSDSIFKLDTLFNRLQSFPFKDILSIEYAGGYFWILSYSTKYVYKTDSLFSKIDSIDVSVYDSLPRGIGHDENFWYLHGWANDWIYSFSFCADTVKDIHAHVDVRGTLKAERLEGDGAAITNVGTWVIVAEKVITGSAVDSVVFTGLDLDAAGTYKINVSIKNATASECGYFMYYNGDHVPTNYYKQYFYSSGSADGSGRENNAEIVWTTGNNELISEIIIMRTPTGYVFATARTVYGAPSSISIHRISHSWVTASNVTQICVKSEIATGIGVGSKFILMKMK